MKKRVLVNFFMVFAILFASIGSTFAQETESLIETPIEEPKKSIPNIFISEVQNNGEGSGTSDHEFIELYNYGTEIINLLDYKLVYVNSTGTDSDLHLFNEPLMFLPETFIIGKLAGSSEEFLTDTTADFEYIKGSSGIAATAGGIRLIDPEGLLIDEIYWTGSASSETPAVVSLVGGMSAQRYYLDDEFVIDEEEDFTKEFTIDNPTPAEFLYIITPTPEENTEQNSTTPEETVEQPELLDNPKIIINELFIDPASPQLDSKDEFVELYNPNNQKINISDYVISAGTTTKYKHTFPQDSYIQAKGYVLVKSSDSSLTLSNSGGQVSLIDNLGRQISNITYQKAESGASWAKSGNNWFWTTVTTPGAINVIKKPVVIVKTSSKKSTSSKRTRSSKTAKTNFTNAPPIKINEIFPDPSSPQKDSQDEFIELYNPYNYSINIADYTITSGATRTYKHTIKAPANIPAKGYYTVTSAVTTLSLTNSGGKVTLINNLDKQIDTVEYPESVPGSSWAFIGGKWQWTASPTKNTANKLSGLIDGLNTNKEDSTTEVAALVAGTDDTPLVPAPQPLPGWLLAVLGVTAVCYAAYEYRFEARNYYYKYRTIRSPR